MRLRERGCGSRFRLLWSVSLGLLLGIGACGGTQLFQSILDDVLAKTDRVGLDPGPPSYPVKAFVNWESPHVSPLALSPDRSRLFAANTPAARIEVFDAGDDGLTYDRSIPVGLDPVTVRARSNDEVWAVNFISGSVSIVDASRGVVTRTLQTDAEPTDVAFSGDRAFVVCRQRNLVQVFNLQDLSQPPQALTIAGLHPRAAALSPDGRTLYVAIFESGNGSTIVRFQDVSDPAGPYGGQNPPPNTLDGFSPPLAVDSPPPPAAGLIVRRNPATHRWLDVQGADWSQFVTWGLHGHDVAAIDTQTLGISYIRDLMNLNMQLAVRSDGVVTVVGTEAFNEIRFEPNVTAKFVRSRLAIVSPGQGSAPQNGAAGTAGTQLLELNGHLLPAYQSSTTTLPLEQRAQSIADPRALCWSSDGTRGYVAGMGSNNVGVIDAFGGRVATFDVGQGPTGLSLDEAKSRLYVMNRFDSSIQVVDTWTLATVQVAVMYDPTPEVIRKGRPFLYNARLTSGLGVTACAACHVDGRMDQLAWDLGAPGDPMKPFDQVCDSLLGETLEQDSRCTDFHPVKGPMLTQTLQGIIGTEPFHWRGDRQNLAEFNKAFVSLNGNHRELTDAEMSAFQAFIETITFPPNPNRKRDNTLKDNLDGGNPQRGLDVYLHQPIDTAVGVIHTLNPILRQQFSGLGPIASCNRCHQLPLGTNHRSITGANLTEPQDMKVPQLRNIHEKPGFDRYSQDNDHGYGFSHEGGLGTLEEFFGIEVFDFGPGDEGKQAMRDVIAFLKSLSVDTHAGVGMQVTLDASNAADPGVIATTSLMLQLADADQVGVVVHGLLSGSIRGLSYRGNGVFQADGKGETWTADQLRAAAAGGPLTWTVVPLGSEDRLGVWGRVGPG